MVDSKPEGEGAQRVELENTGVGPQEGPTEPAQLTQATPSPAFIKENIDVLRTMIKNTTNRPKQRQLQRSLSMTNLKKKIRTAPEQRACQNDSPMSPPACHEQETEPVLQGKSKEACPKAREVSSDTKGEEGSKDSWEDLSTPYKRPKPTPFTTRITRFKYHEKAKLPRNVKVYEGRRDLEDHLGIFSVASEQEEWPMLVWCKMFGQTLSGAARNWYAKDPTEIHSIKIRMNEGLQAFIDRFKSKSSHIKGVPPVLRISTFMHGHGHPKLAKKLNDKIHKMVDEMFERIRAFIIGDAAAGSAEVARAL
ncbi:hypothetical protein Tco_0874545 [Tanacetum coccineum]|uniref:Reverse transcriptase domain-containing protein n=1 Tax=Tanacetum coccineum TaxID=301880 RepID=A0ABQ5BR51_9ASTR